MIRRSQLTAKLNAICYVFIINGGHFFAMYLKFLFKLVIQAERYGIVRLICSTCLAHKVLRLCTVGDRCHNLPAQIRPLRTPLLYRPAVEVLHHAFPSLVAKGKGFHMFAPILNHIPHALWHA